MWRHVVVPICGLVILGYVIIKANVAAQTLGLLWLGVGIVVVVVFYATGRRPQLAGLDHDATEEELRL